MTLATANAKENESKALAELRAEATRAKDLEDLVSRLQGSLEAASSWDPESHFSAMGAARAAEAKHVANAYKGEVRRMSHTASEADLVTAELAALAAESAAVSAAKEAEAKHVVDVYKGEVARLGAADPALVARLEDRAAAAEAVAGALAAAAKEPSDWDSLDGDDTSLELEAARERARREDSRSKAERLALEMELADAEAKVAELKRSLDAESDARLQADLEVAELRETRSSAAGLFSSSEAALRSEIDALREALRTQADERALDEAADNARLREACAAATKAAAAERRRREDDVGAATRRVAALEQERRRLRRSRAEADAASDRTWYETVLPSKKPSSTVLGLRRDLEEVKKTARDAVATARELRRARGDDNEASEDESDAEVAFLALAPDGVPAVLDEVEPALRPADSPAGSDFASDREAAEATRAIERLFEAPPRRDPPRDPPGAIQFFASGDSPRRPASGDSPRRPATPRATRQPYPLFA
ncbi:hypothetical protein JL720_2904 [Aureococcus anophagefferens]|nr:hypothetical protein JL720_2904 [Aureococcus anophagefferens]